MRFTTWSERGPAPWRRWRNSSTAGPSRQCPTQQPHRRLQLEVRLFRSQLQSHREQQQQENPKELP